MRGRRAVHPPCCVQLPQHDPCTPARHSCTSARDWLQNGGGARRIADAAAGATGGRHATARAHPRTRCKQSHWHAQVTGFGGQPGGRHTRHCGRQQCDLELVNSCLATCTNTSTSYITNHTSHFKGAKRLQAVLPSNKRLLTLHNPHMSSATLCPHAAVAGAGNAAETGRSMLL